jgi:hypothetical protein
VSRPGDRPQVERQVAFWREQIAAGPAPSALPTDHPRLPAPSFFRERSEQALADWGAVEALAAHLQVEPFTVVLGALATVAHRHGGEDRLWLGTAARTSAGAPNLVAVLAPVGGTVAEQLRAVQAALADAAQHADVPFAEVAALAGAEPLFRVLALN